MCYYNFEKRRNRRFSPYAILVSGSAKNPPKFFVQREVPVVTSFSFQGVRRGINIFKEHQINNQIRAQELRVISSDNQQLGVMGLSQAMRLADEEGLDLVLISPNAKPPVARIIDYGKYKFETLRREKEQRKTQVKQHRVKEVQLSLNIQENEVGFKMAHAKRFLEDGYKVKVCINRIRGRATMNADKGVAILEKFAADLVELADVEQAPTKAGVPGRNINITMVIAPKKKK